MPVVLSLISNNVSTWIVDYIPPIYVDVSINQCHNPGAVLAKIDTRLYAVTIYTLLDSPNTKDLWTKILTEIETW